MMVPSSMMSQVQNTSTPMAVESERDMSPRSRRKASHNAVEVRRRRRISLQLDRLKSMLNCQKADKASLLHEAVTRLNILTQRCHSLETQLASFKGETPPPPLPPALEVDDDDDAESGTNDPMVFEGSGRVSDAALAAAQGERKLQLWAQVGEQALHDLLLKLEHTQWTYHATRDDVKGYVSELPARDPHSGQRLDFCVKGETIIPLDPETVARAYFEVSQRKGWHSSCTESRLVEELWPNTMCIASFTYRSELPVYPRRYCALVHRATHMLPDERVQIVIVDRSVTHQAVPASSDVIVMDVFPSGLIITPVEQHGETHSHVELVAHFDLKGTISSQLFERIQCNKMLEFSCYKYLGEFRKHLIAASSKFASAGCHSKVAQREAELANEGAATLIYAANSVGS